MTKKLLIEIKWYKNDNGGDRRCIDIDFDSKEDLKTKKEKILLDFRTLPNDVALNGSKIGRIPYCVKFV